ncbi:hypothetical protein TPDSL_18060 [Terrisporobacter petrolearius]|uniref:transglycosylase SLT domain-containing protein n=1 Tax=Terrisporobacter petrolearius TaxID=1460447 RepID=UPI0033690F43
MLVDRIFVLDENKMLVAIFNSKGKNIFFNDTYYSELSTGAETLELSCAQNGDNNFVKEGYYLLFSMNNKYKMFQIKKCTDKKFGNDIVKTLYSEFIGINLRNGFIRPVVIEGNIKKVLETVMVDTDYEIGYISETLKNNIQTVNVKERTSIYATLQNLIPIFGNIEYEFEVKVINSLKSKYKFILNVYADGERGNKTYRRFEDGKNISSLTREVDISDKCNGLIAEGANGITFKDIRWEKEKGFPLNKDEGDDFLLDVEDGEETIIGNFKGESTTPIDLLWETYYKLQEVKKGKIKFETKVILTEDDYNYINIGDTVYVISKNFEPEILQEARINTLKLSFSNSSKNEITFANYKEVKSKIRNWSKEDIINDLTGFTGKLTQADIDRIREYLASLDIQSEEIEKLLKKYEDALEDTVIEKTEIAEDSEDYRAIKLSKIDGGLWLGDNRIYGIKKNKCATITTTKTENTTTTSSSSASATEYKNAVKYYDKFELGKYANSSSLNKLISKSNKYKVSTMVNYWSKKFGLDPYLVYAVIMGESSGNPYCATKSSAGGYGIMQCERAAYFGHKQTIKFLDGSTKSFTPSYSTMKPGGTTTLNGVKVNKGISNQIMFGCHELRKSLVRFKYNIFASLMGYNFGLYGADWVVCKYVAQKNGYTFKDKFGYTAQSSKVQSAYFKELETLKAPWASLRKTYVSQKHMGTWWNIEGYLRWYKSVNGQLPYVIDSKGKKKGYGANKTSTTTVTSNTTTKTGVATSVRNKIVAKAKEIVNLHVKYKKATYNQVPRTCDDTKRIRWYGRHYGMTNPIVYDCSSFVSCCYKNAGLTSVYNRGCRAGSLVAGATKKSGYKMWKVTTEGIKDALPGDIVMDANFVVNSSNLTASNMSKYYKTHHTMIYIGDGKVAHASQWAYHPNAIKISNVSYYQNKGTAFFLRPYDLAAKDANATETTTTTTVTKVIETNEVNIKGLNGAIASDFYDDKSLITDVTINNINDDDAYPKTVSHCFLHFGINDLSDEGIENYKSLIKALMVKYPKKPIFIAKEYHVNSQYGSNFETINAQIDNFNNSMKDFSNRTKYVIMVNVPSTLADASNKYVNSSLTTDGWTMKDKNACNTYYTAYKKAILGLATGGTLSSTATSVSVTLKPQKIHKYTKPVKSLEIKLPSNPDDSFYSRLIFTTNKNSEPTKYKQSNLVYLQGTHCKKGQLILKADTTYDIKVYYNPDTEIANTKYLGSVSAIHKGGSYAKFSGFKYAEQLVGYAKGFYSKNSNFVYNNTTPADFSNPSENISKWKTNGKMHIDDSAFLNYILMGLSYNKSPYGNNSRTDNKKNPNCCWALSSTRQEANIAKYFVEQGWILDGADLVNYSNLNHGDIIFMDADGVNNNEFMGISHTAIVTGKNSSGVLQALECTGGITNGAFRYVNVKDLASKNILFIGRIRIG